MKIDITRNELLVGLLNVVGAIEDKSTTPILQNVLLVAENDTLRLSGTDLQVQISDSAQCQITEEGSITVPAKKFTQIIKALPQDASVNLSIENNELLIKNKRSKFRLSTLDALDYPDLQNAEPTNRLAVEEKQLHELLHSSSYASASNDVRYYLNGMLLDINEDCINSVATDGHRLAVNTLEIEANFKESVIIPRKAVLELTKTLDPKSDEIIELFTDENHIGVKRGSFTFITKLIDGKYPDYLAAIPKNVVYRVKLNRLQFRDSLSKVAILANEKFKGVRLLFENNQLMITANNPNQESAEDLIDIEFDDKLEIGFNVAYVLDAINNVSGVEITLHLVSSGASAMVTTEESDGKHVLMPVRL